MSQKNDTNPNFCQTHVSRSAAFNELYAELTQIVEDWIEDYKDRAARHPSKAKIFLAKADRYSEALCELKQHFG